MSNWADDANKQEKEQVNENLMSKLQEIRLQETDAVGGAAGDKERPHLGGIGRGKPATQNLPNFSFVGNGVSNGMATNGQIKNQNSSPTVTNMADNSFENVAENLDRPQTKEEESYLNKILHDKLVEIKSSVKIQHSDPNSPLYSIKSFEELRLRDELLQGVAAMNFSYPSKIQEAALPMILADPPQSLIAQSQSGTGKTAAFVLCMLSRVDPLKQHPQCICLAPTYELALQIGHVAETMGQFCKDIRVGYAIRNSKSNENAYKLLVNYLLFGCGDLLLVWQTIIAASRRNQRVTEQIIIGTPGTTLDWVLKLKCFDPAEIRVFVLDEADIMISQQGHQDQSVRINKEFPNECQRLLFSATYDDEIMEFANKILNDAILITLRREELPLDNISQYYVECDSQESKFKALCNLYGSLTIGQSMIFCHTKKTASWLAAEMTKLGHSVALLSSELDIEQRAAVIKRFKAGQERVLISTNVCARGIDVEQVTVVINFDLPLTPPPEYKADFDTYLHRIGRTGRFGKAGLAINFIDGNRSRNHLKDIEDYFGKKIMKLDTDDVEVLERIENR